MRCSMRTDRERIHGERRRRFGVVSPPFLSPEGGEEGREGKQDKGSVSQRYVSLCLHIFFLRDTRTRARDKWSGNGGNPPLSRLLRETRAPGDACRRLHARTRPEERPEQNGNGKGKGVTRN